MSNEKWITRWRIEIAAKPALPGVWRRREGGFLVRGRAIDPRTGKRKEVMRVLAMDDANQAFAWLHEELRKIKSGVVEEERKKISFAAFAVSLAEEKVKTGEIKSAQGKQKWASVIEHHLMPAFGDLYVDTIRHSDVIAWRSKLGNRIASGEYSPRTVNTWLSILRVIMKRAVADFELERDPMSLVRDFDISTSHTYTEEEPNSMTADEVASFLAMMKRRFPRHFAFVALGLATGLRPSSLRPLRRAGPAPDFIPSEGILYIRRSHTVGDTVMDKTKTARRQRIVLPPELVALLEAHVASMNEAERESELLFPAITGGLRARSCLDKPFRVVAKEIKLKKTITPRAMRRSFNDLARAAEVKDVVTKAISGHVTDTMQQHYSTVSGLEVCDGIAKVVSLARFKEVLGGKRGGKTTKTKKAG